MLPPKARQMRFSGSWYYTHVGHFKLYLRHLAQILLILTDFSPYTPVYFVRVYIDWFRISTRRIRDGNVRFINASNKRLRDRSFILCVYSYFPTLPFFPFRFS